MALVRFKLSSALLAWREGWGALVVSAVFWNLPPLTALVLGYLLISSGQGQELLQAEQVRANSSWRHAGWLMASVTVFSVLCSWASWIAGTAAQSRLSRLSAQTKLNRQRADRFVRVVLPTAFLLLPCVYLAFQVDAVKTWWLFFFGPVMLTLGGVGLFELAASRVGRRLVSKSADRMPGFEFWLPLLVFALLAGLGLWLILEPSNARRVGALSVLAYTSGAWALFCTLILVAAPLRWLGLNLIWLLPILSLTGGLFADPYRFPVRPTPVASVLDKIAQNRPAVDQYFARWLVARDKESAKLTELPVFLVAADGGGLRAAAWTHAVLTQLDRQTNGLFRRNTFAYSTVSGASLGVTTFLNSHDGAQAKQLFERDFFAPALARLAVTEPLRILFGRGFEGRDRGFERQIVAQWRTLTHSDVMEQPFLIASRLDQEPNGPVMLLNSTSVRTGRRALMMNVAPMSNPPYQDLFGDGPYRALRATSVAGAIHLTARFPGFSPPAHVYRHSDARVLHDRLVDGGFYENSGATSLTEILRVLVGMRQEISRKPATKPEVRAEIGGDHDKQTQANLALSPLLAKVRFIVISIRNEQSDDSVQPGWLVRGLLSDLSSPLDSLLSIRQARAEEARDYLASIVNNEQERLGLLCDSEQFSEKPMPVCERARSRLMNWDKFIKVDLVSHAATANQTCGSGTHEIALGWTLSPRSLCVINNASGQIGPFFEREAALQTPVIR